MEVTDVFMQNWAACQVFANSIPLSDQTEETSSTDNTIVENPAVVPTSFGTSGGFSLVDTSSTRFGSNTLEARVPDAARYLNSYSSQGFSLQALDFMLASWREKANSNYGSSLMV